MKKSLKTLLLILITTVSCSSQNDFDKQINGKWQVKFQSNDIGTVNTILNFETSSDNTFTAWTRKGADRNILGFWKSSLARVFTDDFKNGSLARITNGIYKLENDTIHLAGIFQSAMGKYSFKGTIIDNKIDAILKDGKKNNKGKITGYLNNDLNYPLDNYELIVNEAINISREKIYNKGELESNQWKSFEKKISKKSTKFMDDLELVFGFYYLSSDLPFSHYALTKVENIPDNIEEKELPKNLYLEDKGNNIGLLIIKSFSGTSEEVDLMFEEILSKNYKNLIVDLRNNSGGSVEAGMAFAKRVVDTTLTGGVFLTQKWFNLNKDLPNKEQIKELPVFSEANYDLIITGIHEELGLVLEVKPQEPIFNGNLYILTNNRTASTCEPIVHGLKASERAQIIGQTTAGAMLNGEKFDLRNGFSLYVPTADYYTLDGFRIDQNGVKPNILLENEDALEYTIKLINE